MQTPLLANPVQVTAAIGFETEASWSPDGRTLAYESNQSGNWDIWILELGSPQPVNRTADHQGSDRVPRWAPGGREILFRSERDGGGYYVVSPFGGAVRRIARTATPTERTPAAWSSDGSIIARPVDLNGVQGVDLMSRRDEVTRHLSLPGNENSRYELSWSPDGKWLAYVVGTSTSQEGDLWILRLDDGRATPVTDGRANDWSPTWTPDARALVLRLGPRRRHRSVAGSDFRSRHCGASGPGDNRAADSECRPVARWNQARVYAGSTRREPVADADSEQSAVNMG